MRVLQEAAQPCSATSQCFVDVGTPGIVRSSVGDTDKVCAGHKVCAGDLNEAVHLDADGAGKHGLMEPLLPPVDDAALPDGVATGAAAAAAEGEGPKEDVVVGMLYYAASSVFFASMAVCSKMLQNDGYPVWELLFYRALVILAVSMSSILSTGAA